MQAIDPKDISSYPKSQLTSMVSEMSKMLIVAEKMLQKQDKRIAELQTEIGLKNAKTLFTNESLENMKKRLFARSSEKRDFGPLFNEIATLLYFITPMLAPSRGRRNPHQKPASFVP